MLNHSGQIVDLAFSFLHQFQAIGIVMNID